MLLRREILPLYGSRVAAALSRPRAESRITLWPKHSRPSEGAEELEVSWADLFAILSEWRPWRGRFHHPGWCAATFAPAIRTPANIRSVSALVQRFDPVAGVSAERFREAWPSFEGLTLTTAEHTSTRPAFVAIWPYARLVSLDEHQSAVKNFAMLARGNGLPFDAGAGNAARFVYLPGVVPGQPFEVHELRGSPLVTPR
jgi:hypothetical protein